MDVGRVVNEVFQLFEKHGETDYLGDPISKIDHSVQCAMLAEKEGNPDEIVLGALLHDIWHLVGSDRNMEEMITNGVHLGTKDHDLIGEQFLKNLGFPDVVSDLVRGHVLAKRYLVWKDANYSNSLTPASKMTLMHQGGPITSDEAKEFENSPLFDTIIHLRKWDEAAKDCEVKCVPIDKYKAMCARVLEKTNKQCLQQK